MLEYIDRIPKIKDYLSRSCSCYIGKTFSQLSKAEREDLTEYTFRILYKDRGLSKGIPRKMDKNKMNELIENLTIDGNLTGDMKEKIGMIVWGYENGLSPREFFRMVETKEERKRMKELKEYWRKIHGFNF